MYTIDYQIEDGVLKASVQGVITSGARAADKAREVVGMGMEVGVCRVLVDERNLDISIDVLDIVNIANEFEDQGLLSCGGRLACLHRPGCVNIYKIYETVYKNRSLGYRRFEDPDKALAWLKE